MKKPIYVPEKGQIRPEEDDGEFPLSLFFSRKQKWNKIKKRVGRENNTKPTEREKEQWGWERKGEEALALWVDEMKLKWNVREGEERKGIKEERRGGSNL